MLPAERRRVDLAAERLGGCVLWANDEFFADASNLLKASPPAWRADAWTDRGKWMDGWETRRRRDAGHDVCVIRLGAVGTVREFVVDTTHFKGNQPESCAIDGLPAEPGQEGSVREAPAPDDTTDPDALGLRAADGAELASRNDWVELLAPKPLDPDACHRFDVAPGPPVSHLRFRIVPDGGVARLRAWGVVEGPIGPSTHGGILDLAALRHGGVPLAVSDATFGEARNLLLPGRARNMGEGWETRRRRGEGHDWVVIRLGSRGTVDRVEIDTDHFKGNYPAAASLEVADEPSERAPDDPDLTLPDESAWKPLLDPVPLGPHATHAFDSVLADARTGTHVRLNIYPDGGVARLRVWGRPGAP